MLGAHEKELLEPLTKSMLLPLPCACNTVYVWVEEEGGYVGFSRPGKGCIIRRGGTERATYLDSKITLGETSYKPWDTGRDLETDERVWGGALGPFDFIAKTRFDDEVSDVYLYISSPLECIPFICIWHWKAIHKVSAQLLQRLLILLCVTANRVRSYVLTKSYLNKQEDIQVLSSLIAI